MNLEERCQPIELILSDVDGVLTDGGIVFDNQGIETKRFHVRDGQGIKLWQRAGFRFGLVTGRSSNVVKMRVADLGIDLLRQGADNKRATVKEILASLHLQPRQVAYLGDDLPDLAVVRAAGLGITVADAPAELRESAHYVTHHRGGCGAVRETIEMILKAQRRWDDLIQAYL